MYSVLIIGVALFALIFASITDLKTREVPDFLSYSLMSAGIGINIIFTLVYWDYAYILYSILGFVLFFIVGLLMFYTGQWGGGDSKILMGLGGLFGLRLDGNFPFLVTFFVYILLAGAGYGLIWTIALAIKNRKAFGRQFMKISHSQSFIRIRLLVFGIFLIAAMVFFMAPRSLLTYGSAGAGFLIVLTFYLFIGIKAVEKTCMIKDVTPDKLTEGDWIAKVVRYKGKYLCGPKDLGIEKKQIREIMKLYKAGKIKKITIKEGIPFVPSFLFGYILALVFGGIFQYFSF